LKKKTFISQVFIALAVVLCSHTVLYSQGGFFLPKDKTKDKIAFDLVNNLVIVPVEVNGAKLSFLLDTGVDKTLLFGVRSNDSIEIKNAEPIRIRGLGVGGSITGLKSSFNTLKIGKAIDRQHTIYVVFDEGLNFSKRMGVPIHGILGYDFFSKFVVKTDYAHQKLTFYLPEHAPPIKSKEKLLPLTFHNNKPYIDVVIETLDRSKDTLTVLVDSGSSDALWLFKEKGIIDSLESNYFKDFLGLGISGNIFGVRSYVSSVSLQSYLLNKAKVAIPEKEALENITFYKERDGSIGGEILKRFTAIIDYPNKVIRIKKNTNYNDPFYYNMSGLTIEHDGSQIVKETKDVGSGNSMNMNSGKNDNLGMISISLNTIYDVFMAPKVMVAEVRENSAAAIAGIEIGDELIKINGKSAYKYKLYEINALFSSKVNRKITIVYARNGVEMKTSFRLKKLI